MQPYNFTIDDIGKTVSFQLYPSNILRDDYTDAVIESITKANSVSGTSLAELHQLVYGVLPDTVPNDYRAYNYLTLRLPNGQVKTVGIPWIIADTVKFRSNVVISVEIRGQSVNDITNIRKALAGNGFTQLDITTRDV